MPFAASERHEIWSADVRHLDMIDEPLVGGKAYSMTITDNFSRAILASAVTCRQDLPAFLSVFYRAVERHGAPKTLVTDSGSIFLAKRARAVYAKLGIRKLEIEKGRPWQNFSETTFGIQQRMADWHFQRAESWAELVEVHGRFVSDYNAQSHFAHRRREDGWRSLGEVLSWAAGMRFHPEDLERAFFSERHTRAGRPGLRYPDALEALRRGGPRRQGGGAVAFGEDPHRGARRRGALGLRGRLRRGRWSGRSGRLLEVKKPTLFETSFVPGQMRLFSLAESLGDEGWLKAL